MRHASSCCGAHACCVCVCVDLVSLAGARWRSAVTYRKWQSIYLAGRTGQTGAAGHAGTSQAVCNHTCAMLRADETQCCSPGTPEQHIRRPAQVVHGVHMGRASLGSCKSFACAASPQPDPYTLRMHARTAMPATLCHVVNGQRPSNCSAKELSLQAGWPSRCRASPPARPPACATSG